jgi:hypothetical protein
MIIQNPIDKEIRVTIFGVEYVLPANGELKNIPDNVAEYWFKELHEFLIVKEDSKQATIVEAIKEEIKSKKTK